MLNTSLKQSKKSETAAIEEKKDMPSLKYAKREGCPDWVYMDLGHKKLVLPLIKQGCNIFFPLKIDTSCAAVLENKFVNGVATLLTQEEFEKINLDSKNIKIKNRFTPNYYEQFNFATSPGATNEISSCKQFVIDSPFKNKEKNIIWVNKNDIPSILCDFRSKNILFDSKTFAHIQLIITETNATKIRDNLLYRYPSLNRKKIDSISKKTIEDGGFLVLKETSDGYVYAHRPQEEAQKNKMVPSVVIIPTIVKNSKNNIYLVLNVENRPPMNGKKIVGFPAGLVDKEDGNDIDSLITAASRELFEETCINGESIISNEKVTFLEHFASTSSNLSETFSSVLITGRLTPQMEKKLKMKLCPNEDRYIYTPTNTDGGVTERVCLLKIYEHETLKIMIKQAQQLGNMLNAQTVASLNKIFLDCNGDFRNLFGKEKPKHDPSSW